MRVSNKVQLYFVLTLKVFNLLSLDLVLAYDLASFQGCNNNFVWVTFVIKFKTPKLIVMQDFAFTALVF